jgi:addiction module HigA family antidote
MTSRSQTITRRTRSSKLPPVHPGEILKEEFLKPSGTSQYRLAKDIHVPARRVNEIVHGTRGITPDTALRLARYFGTSPNFWMNLQARYDLEVHRDKSGTRIERDVSRLDAALGNRRRSKVMKSGGTVRRRGGRYASGVSDPHAVAPRGTAR